MLATVTLLGIQRSPLLHIAGDCTGGVWAGCGPAMEQRGVTAPPRAPQSRRPRLLPSSGDACRHGSRPGRTRCPPGVDGLFGHAEIGRRRRRCPTAPARRPAWEPVSVGGPRRGGPKTLGSAADCSSSLAIIQAPPCGGGGSLVYGHQSPAVASGAITSPRPIWRLADGAPTEPVAFRAS